MKKSFMICILAWTMLLAGCTKPAQSIPETVVSTVAERRNVETHAIAETNQTLPEEVIVYKQVYNYELLTEREEDVILVPRMILFGDGTFGLTYDVLSSYIEEGTYEVKGNKLRAVTSEGDKEFNFQIDQVGNLVFIKQESEEITLTDEKIGVPVVDGSVFSLKSVEDESLTMIATVKDVLESSVLVTSHEDSQPGAFYVDVPPTVDLSAFKGGETVTIIWYGLIRETSPAQITAMYMYQQ